MLTQICFYFPQSANTAIVGIFRISSIKPRTWEWKTAINLMYHSIDVYNSSRTIFKLQKDTYSRLIIIWLCMELVAMCRSFCKWMPLNYSQNIADSLHSGNTSLSRRVFEFNRRILEKRTRSQYWTWIELSLILFQQDQDSMHCRQTIVSCRI